MLRPCRHRIYPLLTIASIILSLSGCVTLATDGRQDSLNTSPPGLKTLAEIQYLNEVVVLKDWCT